MPGFFTLAVVAAALFIAWRLIRIKLSVHQEIGQRALADQPATIHLIPAGDRAWRRRRDADALAEPLRGSGFEHAGDYTVDEMPGVVLRLLVRPAEGWLATVYEHPGVGHWLEISVRFQGGGGFAVTNLGGATHEDRPDFPIRRLPGVAPATLLTRMRAEQPAGIAEHLTAERAAERFERGYAEGVAWRKAHQAAADDDALKQAA